MKEIFLEPLQIFDKTGRKVLSKTAKATKVWKIQFFNLYFVAILFWYKIATSI